MTSDYFMQRSSKTTFTPSSWVVLSAIEQSIKDKIEKVGKPLKEWDINIYRGILTGYNEAFIIDIETRDRLVAASPKNAEIIRPILRGRDIKKYSPHWAGLYIINTHTGYKSQSGEMIPPVTIEDYPAIKEHLDKFYPQLSVRQDKGATPYHLRSCIYMEDFFKPKIVWGEISDKSKFAYENNNYFAEATSFLMTGKQLEYLLALLNSKLLEWYFNQLGTATGVGTNRWKKYTIQQLPIKVPSEQETIIIEELVNQMINKSINDNNCIKEIEVKMNDTIYKLYNLTQEEAIYIDNIKI